jgi:hypothetical protein
MIDGVHNNTLVQSHTLPFDAILKTPAVYCDVPRLDCPNAPDKSQREKEHNSADGTLRTLPEVDADLDLISITTLLDGAVRSAIHESAFTEKHQQQAGIKVQSSDFQQRLSEVSPALWSRGYLPVTSLPRNSSASYANQVNR